MVWLSTAHNLGGSAGGGSETFAELTDTPASITANQFVRGNAGGTALEFVSAPTVQGADAGDYRFDNTVDINADVTVTSANVDTYNRKIWLISGGSRSVTISESSGLTYFGVYVRRTNTTGTIISQATSNVRVNNSSDNIVIDARQSATFFAITADRYQEIANNFRPENFTELTDTPSALGTAGQLVAVNTDADELVFIDPAVQADTSFAALTDTPADITATQFVRGNAAGDALEFSSPVIGIENDGTDVGSAINTINFTNNITAATGDAGEVNVSVSSNLPRNWVHRNLNTTSIGSDSGIWYTFTLSGGIGIANRRLPAISTITAGWFIYIVNDSTAGMISVTGDFIGTRTGHVISAQESAEISYNGTEFIISVINNLPSIPPFPAFTQNPLSPSSTYTSSAGVWTTSATGFALDRDTVRAATLNNTLRFESTLTTDFIITLPPLVMTNITQYRVGDGYGFINNSQRRLSIRPFAGTEIRLRGNIYTNTNVIEMFTGSSLTVVRSNDTSWIITSLSGTIT